MSTSATPHDDTAELRHTLIGSLYLPGDAGFAAAVDDAGLQLPPAVVVAAEGTADVVAAVRYAADHDLSVAVRATGRIGVSGGRHLLISTDRMNSVTIDPHHRRATVAAGTRWSSVLAASAPLGLAPLNGWSPGGRVVEEALGGGPGPLSRRFGLAADHVTRMTLVLADGEVTEVGPDSRPELYWALCGGQSQVGIVTELDLELVAPDRCYGGRLIYPGEAASSLLHAFRGWCRWLPDRATASISLLRLPEHPDLPAAIRGRPAVRLRFLLTGGDDGPELLAPMRQVAAPLLDSVVAADYHELVIGRDPIGEAATGEGPSVRDAAAQRWRDGALLGEFGADAAEALLAIAGPDADAPVGMVEIQQLGGAMTVEPPGGNAVGGRDAGFALRLAGPNRPDGWGGGVLRALAPWTSGRQISLLGGDATTEQIRRAWPPEVYLRLLRIKRRFDPTELFRFGHPLRDPRVYAQRSAAADDRTQDDPGSAPTGPAVAGGLPTSRM